MFRKEGKALWNDGWQFRLDDGDWQSAELPHDWLIYDTQNLYRSGTGQYRKAFVLTAGDLEQSLELYFDGVYMNCTVYINDVCVFEWKNGYTPFHFDITGHVREGENVVLVSVKHESPNSRWYSGAGIYRNVWLIRQPKAHIITDSVYIHADVSGEVRVEAQYTGDADELRYTIEGVDGLTVANPVLWSPDNPHIYNMKTELLKSGELIDCVYNKFGFRSISFSPDDGFLLNGKPFKLHGVCQHHDLGALGAAFNVHAARRQLDILMSMGVNSIRTSHNPPAAELIELCDELGLLVVDEFTDMWELSKTEFDYARFFPQWYARDVETWIKRDRNHPCVIMWSIGNEIFDTHVSERGLEVARNLNTEVLRHDPHGNARVTIGSNFMSSQNAQNVAGLLGLAGYNYAEGLYDEHRARYPDWFIYGSETASTVRSRGIYHLPADASLLTHDDRQCSDLGNSVVGWGKSNEGAWRDDRDRRYCGGQYIWTGFDYIGEPTPYSTKNSYFGAIDTAGLPKASYYFYKAVWNRTAEPFVKIFPHWDWNRGQLIDVMTYSNVYKVELFLNGTSLGMQTVNLDTCDVFHSSWRVVYEPGELIAKAYNTDGSIIATDRTASFGDTSELRTEESCYGYLRFITISAYDKNGEFAANARDRIRVSVGGNARLLGLDNGDSTDYDSYKGDNRRLFSGQLTAIVQGDGDIEVDIDRSEIPVRKIELTAERRALSADNPEAAITSSVLPSNATYSDIEWKCVLDNGVVTNIAEVIPAKTGATVKAKGDGNFRLRAYCKNNSEFPQVISELEFNVTGMGQPTRNPYELVAASFYNFSSGKLNTLMNGGINGIKEDTVIGFNGIDFGKTGSNRFTFYVGCEHDVPVEIRYGNPSEAETELFEKFLFKNNKMWENFKPQEFILSKNLCDVRNLCFVFGSSCTFGGFEFIMDSFGQINAAMCDNVYGDSFEVSADNIIGIGNNVFVEFAGMDFGEVGASRLTICGRTPNAVNSIRLSYGDRSQTLEFKQSAEYTEQTFELQPITGRQDISFVFLPGSNFDFARFKFDE